MRPWIKNFLQVYLLCIVMLAVLKPGMFLNGFSRSLATTSTDNPFAFMRVLILFILMPLYMAIYTSLAHYSFVFMGNFSLKTTFRSDLRIGALFFLANAMIFFFSNYISEDLAVYSFIFSAPAFTYYLQSKGFIFKKWYSFFNYILGMVYMFVFSLGLILILAKAVGHSMRLGYWSRFILP